MSNVPSAPDLLIIPPTTPTNELFDARLLFALLMQAQMIAVRVDVQASRAFGSKATDYANSIGILTQQLQRTAFAAEADTADTEERGVVWQAI